MIVTSVNVELEADGTYMFTLHEPYEYPLSLSDLRISICKFIDDALETMLRTTSKMIVDVDVDAVSLQTKAEDDL